MLVIGKGKAGGVVKEDGRSEMEDGGIGKRRAQSGKKGVSLLGFSDGGNVGDFGFWIFDV